MNFEELQIKVFDWAIDKNLLEPNNAPKQFMKVSEELGELASSILKGNREEELDAFGDVMVTLIILSFQRGVLITEALEDAYQVIENRKGKTVNGTFIKE